MTSEEFLPGLMLIRSAFGHRFNETDQIRAWFLAFRNVPRDLWEAAVARCLVEHQGGFPSIALLVGYVDELVNGIDPGYDVAFEQLMKAVKRYGFYEAEKGMESLTPLIRKTVNALGGFTVVCDNPIDQRGTLRAQFRDIYNSKKQQERTLRRLPERYRPKLNNLPEVREAVGRIGVVPEKLKGCIDD